MNTDKIKYGELLNYDIISHLPTDKSQPTEKELLLLDSLFKEKKSSIKKITDEAYEPFIVGILFVILSLPKVNEVIISNISITKNSIYFLLLFKMFVIMILFWLVKHFHLCKK